jgi:hypothetical protein
MHEFGGLLGIGKAIDIEPLRARCADYDDGALH